MTIKAARLVVAISAAWCLCTFAGPITATAAPPNVVLMMGDDHGWEETGYHGHPHVKTPVLDEMASGGLRLDRFYAAHPSCSPTRASFLTGRHPNRMGTFAPGWSFRPEEITLARLLGRGRLSLRALRQVACRRGQKGIARESRRDGLSPVALARQLLRVESLALAQRRRA
jgi:hypothetical protein